MGLMITAGEDCCALKGRANEGLLSMIELLLSHICFTVDAGLRTTMPCRNDTAIAT